MIISSATDFREAARRRLPPFLFHYLDGGGAEQTLRVNVDQLQAIKLRQRVLRGSEELDLGANWFGQMHRQRRIPHACPGGDGVLLGRAFVYALAGMGEAGVDTLLAIMNKDLRTNIVLAGVKSVREIGSHVLTA